MSTSEVNLVTIQYIHAPHHGHTKVNIMVINGLTSLLLNVNRPFHSWDKVISNFDLENQSRCHGCGQRARSYNRPVCNQYTSFSFHINQTKISWGTSIFEIWPWNSQGQGHERGQSLRSHRSSSIQPMHFLFVWCQSDHSFLRYGHYKMFDLEKTYPKCWGKKSPKSSQVISMTRGM